MPLPTEPHRQTEPNAAPGPDATAASSAPPELTQEQRKANRTLGLRLFDIFLYPFSTNFVVIGLSVYTTYLTNKGHTAFKPGTIMDGVGKFFHRRGTMLEDTLMQRTGMSKESAGMTKMVFFSFLDGTFIAPFVKLFEDRREKIGKWIDDKLGTTPANLAVYESEPKQTWGSVIKGRVVTVVPVAITAAVLDKTNLNNFFFRKPGEFVGKWMSSTSLQRRFPRTDFPELMRTTFFEGFYTSVCTTGLYYASRIFARQHDEKTGRIERDPVTHRVHARGPIVAPPPAANENTKAPANENTKTPANENTPLPQVHHIAPQDRIAMPAVAIGQPS